jgi:tRNA nucleotidyltransferase (CCA-adding enzyme)
MDHRVKPGDDENGILKQSEATNIRLPVEVTTFRCDGAYLDGRHPSNVRFTTSLTEDLARRDFTINAIALGLGGEAVDPYDGRGDLERKVVRCVGDPDARLQEDALRIMRALRFASVLDFSIDTELAAALHRNRELLARVAPERVSSELIRLLTGPGVLDVLLEYPDVLAVFIPEVAPCVGFDQRNIYHVYDVWGHTAHAVAAAVDDPLVRLALLFHDLGKPQCFFVGDDGVGHMYGHDKASAQIAHARLRALHFDNRTVDDCTQLVHYHASRVGPENIVRWFHRLDPVLVRQLLDVKFGDIVAHSGYKIEHALAKLEEARAAYAEALEREAAFKMSDLVVGGRDIMELGVSQGPQVGVVLRALLDDVLDGKIENDRDALLARAREIIDMKKEQTQ